MMMGSFAVPIATLIFFFELNTPKNISFYNVIKYFLVGGCASLVSTLFLFEFVTAISNQWIEAMVIGVVEEVGKLVIVAFIIWRSKKSDYLLNGLLIGAAVGAGFAAFESAGYAFRQFIVNIQIQDGTFLIGGAYEAMVDNIFLRAFLAPGGHVIWAAMAGYATILVNKKGSNFDFSFFSKGAFWKIFLIPIILHAVWDMPITFGGSKAAQIAFLVLLIVLGWLVTFILMANSLSQIGSILKQKNDERMASEQQAAVSGGESGEAAPSEEAVPVETGE